MAAHEYYNSFNGGTPQMMASNPAPYEPSSATAPPPYQEFHPSQANLHQQGQQQQQPYNIADFKYNYDPNITYGPSTPPQQYAQLARPPRQQQQQQVYQTPYASMANLHSNQAPYASTANLRVKPQQPYLSTTSLRPQRSSSEPPSPYQSERKSSSSRPHASDHRRTHHHSHSHSHSRRRSRSRSRSRDRSRDRGERERPRGKVHKEKNTFLGAIGGSVVGDLIFPGLGTLGGAILGGLGGHEATKKKERDRERERNGGGSGRERRRGRSYEEEWIEGKRRRGEY